MVLGQLPPRKIAPNPKTNPQPNLTLTEEQLFLRAIVWLPPKPKTNPDLDPNSNHNQGAIFLGWQLSEYQNIYINSETSLFISCVHLIRKKLHKLKVLNLQSE